jgi:hypothetical protein
VCHLSSVFVFLYGDCDKLQDQETTRPSFFYLLLINSLINYSPSLPGIIMPMAMQRGACLENMGEF